MTFEPNYEKISAANRVFAGSTQSVVELKLPQSDSSNVARVLCASAQVYLSSSALEQKNVTYSGVVRVQVHYVTENGAIGSADYSAPFSDKYTLDAEYENATPVVLSQVVDTKTNVTNGEVRVTLVVESNVDLIVTTELNALVGVASDSVMTKSATTKYVSYAGLTTEQMDNTFDIQLKDNVSQVLGVCVNAYIKKVTPFNNYAKVDCGIDMDITYLDNEQEPQVRTCHTCVDYSHETTFEGITQNSAIMSYAMIKPEDMRFTTNIDKDITVVSAFIPVMYRGYVFNEKETEVVSDLFSTTNYLTTSTQSVLTLDNILNVYCTEKLDGNLSLDDSRPFIDEFIGVSCAKAVVNNSFVADGELTVEGLVDVCTLYLNKELNSVNSANVQIPFSVVLSGEYANDTKASVEVAFGDIDARSRRGKEIDVSGTLYVYANTYSDEQTGVITSVEIDDEIPESGCALSIVVAKDGEDLWDIAKREYVSPDMIAEQNPNLDLPLHDGDRVVIYRQHVAEF
ncbi:MAG: DUF3794 domain-containing protein [Clostridia bacterium]|nr:DUF3794 domain-containing protein [Clostridia bacterium]